MRKVIKYYSEDEHEFDTEEACLAYENKLESMFNSVKWFNANFQEVKTVSDIVSYACYAMIIDKDLCKDLFMYLRSETTVPEEASYKFRDVYCWDYNNSSWYNLTEEVKDLTARLNKLNDNINNVSCKVEGDQPMSVRLKIRDLFRSFKRKCLKDLREKCREKYGDDFVKMYDMVGAGTPIGNLEETIIFLEMVEAASVDKS